MLAGLIALVVAAGLWFGLRDATRGGGTGQEGSDASAAPGDSGPEGPSPVPASGRPAAAGRPGSVGGRVLLLATGEPVPGVIVVLSVGESPRRGVTRSDGRFLVADVPPGEGYLLAVEHGEFARVDRPGIVVLPGEETDVGTLYLAPAVTLLVRVLDGADTPIRKATVLVFASSGPQTRFDRGSWRDVVFAAMTVPSPLRTGETDEKGEASIPGLAAGWCFVAASAEGFGRAGVETLLVPERAGEPVVVRLGKGFVLTGRVTDENGDPVAGRVLLDPSGGSRVGFDSGLRREAVLDAEGRYRFDGIAAGSVILSVVPEGKPLVRAGFVRVPDVPVFDIRLRAGATLAGTVTDEAGAPVAGAEVRTLVSGTFDPGMAGGAAMTGPDGTYRLTGLSQGYVSWIGVTAEGFVQHPPPGTPGRTLTLTAGEELTVDVVLLRGVALSGVVTVAETGAPLPGARVIALPLTDLRDRDDSVTAGEDGRYRFPALAPGEYLMRVEAEGYCQQGLAPDGFGRMGQGAEIDPRLSVRIGKDGPPVEKDLVVQRGGGVSGRVEDGLGRPVTGVRVQAATRSSAEFALSAADGTFRIGGLAEGQTWVFAERGGDRAMHGPVVLGAGGEISDIVLVLKAGSRVAGRVEVAGDGSPAGGRVGYENPAQGFGWGGVTSPVAEDGSFVLDGVPPGNVVLVATVPGYPPGRSDPVTVPEGGEVEGVRIRVAAGLSLSGSVELRTGGPVDGAQIRVQGGMGGLDGSTVGQSDPGGKFAIHGLAPGRYFVSAFRDGYTAAYVQNVDPQEGESILLVMEVGGEITGQVEDESGRPVAGTIVTAAAADGGRSMGVMPTANSGLDGSFRIRGLPDGEYRVTAGAAFGGPPSDFVPDTREGVRPGDEPLHFRLRSGLRIGGTVRGLDGEPLGGLGVHVVRDGMGPDQGAGVVAQAQTAWDGSFALGGLTPGTYSVTVQGWGRGYPEVTKRGISAGTEGLEFVVGAGREITGSVTGPDGQGVSGAQVSAVPAPGASGSSRQAGTSGDGSFRLQGLAPGVYTVTVSAPGRFAPAVVDDVPAGTTGISVALEEGKALAGILLGEDGAPLPKITVTATPAGRGVQARVDTDGEGRWKITGLSEGPHVLGLVPREDGFRLREPVSAEAGAEEVKLHAVACLSISGTVTDRRGRAVQHAMVFAADGGGMWARSEADGRFRLTGLDPGEYRLTVWAPGAGQMEIKARAGDQALDIRLE
ncbi:MAG: carboxypeptidase-like regulatory domain-containing protein [Planctomycetes bacterium]|nr:carboxypeptidase-like regulatory domain-containing protein [Planctomycetota bacterium]